MVGNGWYKLKGGDSTRKKKSKIQNKNFPLEALFSRKSTLNFRSVRVHFLGSFCSLNNTFVRMSTIGIAVSVMISCG